MALPFARLNGIPAGRTGPHILLCYGDLWAVLSAEGPLYARHWTGYAASYDFREAPWPGGEAVFSSEPCCACASLPGGWENQLLGQ